MCKDCGTGMTRLLFITSLTFPSFPELPEAGTFQAAVGQG